MLVAPYLGTLAKNHVQTEKQAKKLELLLTKARHRKSKNSSDADISAKSAPRKTRNRSPGKPRLESLPEHLASEKPITPSKNTGPSHQSFIDKMKTFARARDFVQAEEAFLRHLEDKALSPLESLQRHAEFKKKFQGLADYLASDAKKSKNL